MNARLNRCEQKILNPNSSTFQRCTGEIVEAVWCPTWVNTNGTMPKMQKGWTSIVRGPSMATDQQPLLVCAECLKAFKPETNPHSKDAEIYFGVDALMNHRYRFELYV